MFDIRSGASGTGKTRNAVADACLLAFPLRFNSAQLLGNRRVVIRKFCLLFTEQTDIQIKKMILAYLTDINESSLSMVDLLMKKEREFLKASRL